MAAISRFEFLRYYPRSCTRCLRQMFLVLVATCSIMRSVSDSSTFEPTNHVDSSRQSLAFGFTNCITLQRFTRLPVNSSRRTPQQLPKLGLSVAMAQIDAVAVSCPTTSSPDPNPSHPLQTHPFISHDPPLPRQKLALPLPTDPLSNLDPSRLTSNPPWGRDALLQCASDTQIG